MAVEQDSYVARFVEPLTMKFGAGQDPTTLHEGDELPVRVLKNGAPYADFSLNAVAAGEMKGETRKTDSAGRVVFRLNKAGPWLLRGTDVRKSTKADTDWESDFATLTLEVKTK